MFRFGRTQHQSRFVARSRPNDKIVPAATVTSAKINNSTIDRPTTTTTSRFERRPVTATDDGNTNGNISQPGTDAKKFSFSNVAFKGGFKNVAAPQPNNSSGNLTPSPTTKPTTNSYFSAHEISRKVSSLKWEGRNTLPLSKRRVLRNNAQEFLDKCYSQLQLFVAAKLSTGGGSSTPAQFWAGDSGAVGSLLNAAASFGLEAHPIIPALIRGAIAIDRGDGSQRLGTVSILDIVDLEARLFGHDSASCSSTSPKILPIGSALQTVNALLRMGYSEIGGKKLAKLTLQRCIKEIADPSPSPSSSSSAPAAAFDQRTLQVAAVAASIIPLALNLERQHQRIVETNEEINNNNNNNNNKSDSNSVADEHASPESIRQLGNRFLLELCGNPAFQRFIRKDVFPTEERVQHGGLTPGTDKVNKKARDFVKGEATPEVQEVKFVCYSRKDVGSVLTLLNGFCSMLDLRHDISSSNNKHQDETISILISTQQKIVHLLIENLIAMSPQQIAFFASCLRKIYTINDYSTSPSSQCVGDAATFHSVSEVVQKLLVAVEDDKIRRVSSLSSRAYMCEALADLAYYGLESSNTSTDDRGNSSSSSNSDTSYQILEYIEATIDLFMKRSAVGDSIVSHREIITVVDALRKMLLVAGPSEAHHAAASAAQAWYHLDVLPWLRIFMRTGVNLGDVEYCRLLETTYWIMSIVGQNKNNSAQHAFHHDAHFELLPLKLWAHTVAPNVTQIFNYHHHHHQFGVGNRARHDDELPEVANDEFATENNNNIDDDCETEDNIIFNQQRRRLQQYLTQMNSNDHSSNIMNAMKEWFLVPTRTKPSQDWNVAFCENIEGSLSRILLLLQTLNHSLRPILACHANRNNNKNNTCKVTCLEDYLLRYYYSNRKDEPHGERVCASMSRFTRESVAVLLTCAFQCFDDFVSSVSEKFHLNRIETIVLDISVLGVKLQHNFFGDYSFDNNNFAEPTQRMLNSAFARCDSFALPRLVQLEENFKNNNKNVKSFDEDSSTDTPAFKKMYIDNLQRYLSFVSWSSSFSQSLNMRIIPSETVLHFWTASASSSSSLLTKTLSFQKNRLSSLSPEVLCSLVSLLPVNSSAQDDQQQMMQQQILLRPVVENVEASGGEPFYPALLHLCAVHHRIQQSSISSCISITPLLETLSEMTSLVSSKNKIKNMIRISLQQALAIGRVPLVLCVLKFARRVGEFFDGDDSYDQQQPTSFTHSQILPMIREMLGVPKSTSMQMMMMNDEASNLFTDDAQNDDYDEDDVEKIRTAPAPANMLSKNQTKEIKQKQLQPRWLTCLVTKNSYFIHQHKTRMHDAAVLEVAVHSHPVMQPLTVSALMVELLHLQRNTATRLIWGEVIETAKSAIPETFDKLYASDIALSLNHAGLISTTNNRSSSSSSPSSSLPFFFSPVERAHVIQFLSPITHNALDRIAASRRYLACDWIDIKCLGIASLGMQGLFAQGILGGRSSKYRLQHSSSFSKTPTTQKSMEFLALCVAPASPSTYQMFLPQQKSSVTCSRIISDNTNEVVNSTSVDEEIIDGSTMNPLSRLTSSEGEEEHKPQESVRDTDESTAATSAGDDNDRNDTNNSTTGKTQRQPKSVSGVIAYLLRNGFLSLTKNDLLQLLSILGGSSVNGFKDNSERGINEMIQLSAIVLIQLFANDAASNSPSSVSAFWKETRILITCCANSDWITTSVAGLVSLKLQNLSADSSAFTMYSSPNNNNSNSNISNAKSDLLNLCSIGDILAKYPAICQDQQLWSNYAKILDHLLHSLEQQQRQHQKQNLSASTVCSLMSIGGRVMLPELLNVAKKSLHLFAESSTSFSEDSLNGKNNNIFTHQLQQISILCEALNPVLVVPAELRAEVASICFLGKSTSLKKPLLTPRVINSANATTIVYLLHAIASPTIHHDINNPNNNNNKVTSIFDCFIFNNNSFSSELNNFIVLIVECVLSRLDLILPSVRGKHLAICCSALSNFCTNNKNTSNGRIDELTLFAKQLLSRCTLLMTDRESGCSDVDLFVAGSAAIQVSKEAAAASTTTTTTIKKRQQPTQQQFDIILKQRVEFVLRSVLFIEDDHEKRRNDGDTNHCNSKDAAFGFLRMQQAQHENTNENTHDTEEMTPANESSNNNDIIIPFSLLPDYEKSLVKLIGNNAGCDALQATLVKEALLTSGAGPYGGGTDAIVRLCNWAQEKRVVSDFLTKGLWE